MYFTWLSLCLSYLEVSWASWFFSLMFFLNLGMFRPLFLWLFFLTLSSPGKSTIHMLVCLMLCHWITVNFSSIFSLFSSDCIIFIDLSSCLTELFSVNPTLLLSPLVGVGIKSRTEDNSSSEFQQLFMNKHLSICCLVKFCSSRRAIFDHVILFYNLFFCEEALLTISCHNSQTSWPKTIN